MEKKGIRYKERQKRGKRERENIDEEDRTEENGGRWDIQKKRELDNHRYGVIKKRKLKMWKKARGRGKVLTKRKIK